MRVVIECDAQAVSEFVADRIAMMVNHKPDCVLGLATGSTPIQTYRRLIQKHQEQQLDFSRVTTFNLDEYVGLSPDHPQSYRSFMNENLFSQLNVDLGRTHVPDGLANDLSQVGRDYEEQIRVAGGIDLQLLGIGADGHIAFNEPGSSLASRTRVKHLDEQTILDNSRFFERPEEVPRLAITMGVGTILEARQCVLMATGAGKAEAIQAMIEGHVTSQITASALQMHADAIVVVDEAAADKLVRKDYYRTMEAAQREIENSRRRSFNSTKPRFLLPNQQRNSNKTT